ncbi:MAG TPA: sigma-E factor negative regulatory protein [Thermomonas sp.]|jgi:negative regulator of sigma E activity|uniref:sigma-E factor negative regulatory protein n=1 Tax=Thermomonas sp. TaxID=1971895 RepID=UPI002CA50B9E|nr:sigma-E factor negative regulatory protein [Thermomonas sp.]HOV96494.1 sigma-E factor negative regulatory protein [Thermomonas sp.]
MTTETDRHCTDLTQLSSREQLSALMDGALPEDQTRFLLRRLQHDAELAASWERWRLAGDTLRGVAPAQRLPLDFALRVSTSLHGVGLPSQVTHSAQRGTHWRRWGTGTAVAAALAVVALLARTPLQPAAHPAQAPARAPTLALAVPPPATPKPAPATPPAPTALAHAPEFLAAATALAASKPARRTRNQVAPVLVAAGDAPVAASVVSAAPVEIASRPWPRKILPQYDSNSGLTVGFGEHAGPLAAPNPFVSPVFAKPPKLLSDDAPAQLKTHAPAEASLQP